MLPGLFDLSHAHAGSAPYSVNEGNFHLNTFSLKVQILTSAAYDLGPARPMLLEAPSGPMQLKPGDHDRELDKKRARKGNGGPVRGTNGPVRGTKSLVTGTGLHFLARNCF